MSDNRTLRERITALEVLVAGLIYHQRWTMGILSALVVGIFLFALPGCVRLLSGIGSGM